PDGIDISRVIFVDDPEYYVNMVRHNHEFVEKDVISEVDRTMEFFQSDLPDRREDYGVAVDNGKELLPFRGDYRDEVGTGTTVVVARQTYRTTRGEHGASSDK